MKGMRFGKKINLIPRYIGLYEIVRYVREVTYELDLPSKLVIVHTVFYVLMLRKYIGNPYFVVPIESFGVKDSLSNKEISVKILDRQVRRLKNKEVA